MQSEALRGTDYKIQNSLLTALAKIMNDTWVV